MRTKAVRMALDLTGRGKVEVEVDGGGGAECRASYTSALGSLSVSFSGEVERVRRGRCWYLGALTLRAERSGGAPRREARTTWESIASPDEADSCELEGFFRAESRVRVTRCLLTRARL